MRFVAAMTVVLGLFAMPLSAQAGQMDQWPPVGPEGQGYVQLGYGYSPWRLDFDLNLEGPEFGRWTSTYDPGYSGSFQFGLPVFKGLGFVASGKADVSKSTTSTNIAAQGPSSYENDGFGPSLHGQFNLYPGAWAGSPFIPGVSANADGWLLWPTIELGYNFSRSESTVHWSSGTGNYWIVDHDLTFGLTLPIFPYLSLVGGYVQNLTIDWTDKTYLANNHHKWQLGARTYINLIHEAGADKRRAFIPGFGRWGQAVVDIEWVTNIDSSQSISSQTRSLRLGTPCTDYVGVEIGVDEIEPSSPDYLSSNHLSINSRNANTFTYSISATLAFGSPHRREGHDNN